MDSFIAVGSILYLAIIIFYFIVGWKIYEKADQPGWASIIPIYNIYILTKIIGKPGIWVLWMLVPFVSIVFGIWALNLLSKSFGKGVGFTLGLLFLGFIFFPILAFGDAKYQRLVG